IVYFAVGIPVLGLNSFFGLPLFTSGLAGLEALIEEGGGYLWGFLASTIVIGLMLRGRRRPDFYRILFSMIVGLVVLYLLGAVQYLYISKASVNKLVQFNIPAFFAADILKAIVAALIAGRVRGLMYRS
ncbi:MAG: biotin transporter BioY, partial [Terriglobia bacterium]